VLGLTSLPLAIMLGGLAAGLLVGVIGGWPQLAGPGARPVVVRLIALCALHATVLMLAFVIVNRANGFYSSWSDLLGRYKGGGKLVTVTVPEATLTVRSSALVSVGASRPVKLPDRSQPVGSLQTVRIRGQLSGLSLAGYVYLPPGYPHGAPNGARYPVIVAISGSPGSSTSPYGAEGLAATVAAQIVAGRLQPLMLVILPAGVRSDPGCLNVPAGPQAALFFGQDLPAAIGSGYPASSQGSAWALLGDALGGYCALQLALTNASTFGAVAVPPGSYQVPPGPPAWAGSPQIRIQDDLAWLFMHQPMQPISLLMFGPGPAGVFASQARPPMQVTSVSLASGPWPLSPVIDWLGRELSAGGNHA
jgi:enterochelin esterase-like enzyme